jgi:hypothetical protein
MNRQFHLLTAILFTSASHAQLPTFEWVKQTRHSATSCSQSSGFSICADDNGNVYTAGVFLNGVDFDPGQYTTNKVENGFYAGRIYRGDEDGKGFINATADQTINKT